MPGPFLGPSLRSRGLSFSGRSVPIKANLFANYEFHHSSPIFTFRSSVRHTAWHPTFYPLFPVLQTIQTIHLLKALGLRISKLIFPSVSYTNTKIHKNKYTNTQIQQMRNCQKDPTNGIFLKRGLFKDIKNDIPMCQKPKYKNTNTQIHKHTDTQIQH